MSTVDLINLISSIASLILSVVAIWLSLYFYSQSKNTEKSVSDSLSGIQAQTDSLQKLTGKWMDRLTKFVTDPSSHDSAITQLIEVIKVFPGNSANLPQLQNQVELMTQEAVSGFIGMHYYCAVANVFAQDRLPTVENFDPTIEYHNLIKSLLDNSFETFNYLDDLLGRVDKTRMDVNPLSSWYVAAQQQWKDNVRNATQVFTAQSSLE